MYFVYVQILKENGETLPVVHESVWFKSTCVSAWWSSTPGMDVLDRHCQTGLAQHQTVFCAALTSRKEALPKLQLSDPD